MLFPASIIRNERRQEKGCDVSSRCPRYLFRHDAPGRMVNPADFVLEADLAVKGAQDFATPEALLVAWLAEVVPALMQCHRLRYKAASAAHLRRWKSFDEEKRPPIHFLREAHQRVFLAW